MKRILFLLKTILKLCWTWPMKIFLFASTTTITRNTIIPWRMMKLLVLRKMKVRITSALKKIHQIAFWRRVFIMDINNSFTLSKNINIKNYASAFQNILCNIMRKYLMFSWQLLLNDPAREWTLIILTKLINAQILIIYIINDWIKQGKSICQRGVFREQSSPKTDE